MQALKTDVRESLRLSNPRREQELPWIVYSAEFGYAYAGEEYWPSFEAQTPRWRSNSRHWIRDAFRRFSTKYNGAEPAGAWAHWFSIISWPITHGILPRDLQRQLARLLFDARATFRPDLIDSAPVLGDHLRELSSTRSTRFQQFAENSILLGQIAAALLLQDKNEDSWILPSTLSRIIDDIGRERSAREWLDEARAAAHLRFKGLRRLSAHAPPPGAIRAGEPETDARITREESPERMVKPFVFLRQIDVDVWQVMLTLTGLRDLAAKRPHIRQFLSRSQATVGGLGGRTVGRGYFLTDSAPTIRLGNWPDQETPLVRFDSTPPDLALLLDSVLRGPSGQSWLFKIDATGLAREIGSRTVHPGESYVFLTKRPYDRPAPILKKVRIECEGVSALRLDIPAVVEEPWLTILQLLGLSVVSTIRVWPAGLPNPSWSGGGSAEWLSSDEIILGLEADHQLSTLDVTLRTGTLVASHTFSIGRGMFLSLGKLPPGEFKAEFKAVYDGPSAVSGRPQQPLRADLRFVVRRPRDSGTTADGGILRLVVHPQPPSLEEIWEGRCEILLTAPTAKVAATVSLFARGRDEPVFEKLIPSLPIPLDTGHWNSAFISHVRRAAENIYDDASACRIEFSARELGTALVVAEREFVPLRWAAWQRGTTVKLINLTGSDAEVSIYPSSHPDSGGQLIPIDAVSQVYQVPERGALFLATLDSTRAGIVVVPSQAFTSFSQLASRPTVARFRLDLQDVERLLLLAANWEQSRVSGSALAEVYRSSAVEALLSELFATVCGENWARVERKIIDAGGVLPEHRSEAKAAVTSRREESGIAAAIALKQSELATLSPAGRVEILAQLIHSFLGSRTLTPRQSRPTNPLYSTERLTAVDQAGADPSVHRLAEFALRLASSPGAAVSFATADLRQFLTDLIQKPLVARAARFMVFSVAAVSTTERRWIWQ